MSLLCAYAISKWVPIALYSKQKCRHRSDRVPTCMRQSGDLWPSELKNYHTAVTTALGNVHTNFVFFSAPSRFRVRSPYGKDWKTCQLSLAIPAWVGAMSTRESWNLNRHTAWCTSPVSDPWSCSVNGCLLRPIETEITAALWALYMLQ